MATHIEHNLRDRMRGVQQPQSLPFEIILNVIDFVVPNSNLLILVPNHPTTLTLLSLSLTSRSIYPVSRQKLYTHCMHIHTIRRVMLLLRTLDAFNQQPQCPPNVDNLLSSITSLYLCPAPPMGRDSWFGIESARRTKRLLDIVGPHLRRLLFDMPLRRLYPEDDVDGVRPILRSAFSNLPCLEEFCSIRDELYLQTDTVNPSEEPPVWSYWPKLKILALYNQLVDGKFFAFLKGLQHIETVVLTRSDGLEEVNLKQEWKNQFGERGQVRPLTLLLVNVDSDHPRLRGKEDWRDDDPMKLKEFNVPIAYYGDEDKMVLCQLWVKRKFLLGEPTSEWS